MSDLSGAVEISVAHSRAVRLTSLWRRAPSPTMLAGERRGCAADDAMEAPREVTLIGKPRHQCDIGQCEGCFSNERLSAANTRLLDKRDCRHTRALFEETREVKAADLNDVGKVGQRDRRVEMVFNEFGNTGQLDVAQRRGRTRYDGLECVVAAKEVSGERSGDLIDDQHLRGMRGAIEFGDKDLSHMRDRRVARFEYVAKRDA